MNLPDDEMEKLRVSALLHDVGKISIDDNILKKPAPLTNDEYEVMKGHPQKGFKIMSQIPAMRDFLPGMYMHHEMINGQGYPQGLKGEEIPMQARIVSVADTFDAMTTDRPYQRAMKFEDALARIKSFVGTRYDERVVESLMAACRSGQVTPGRVRLKRPPKAVASEPSPVPIAEQPSTQAPAPVA
jgi:HD-GYP domain-containing protein (c-di-GMP phosphodiesterase class II)